MRFPALAKTLRIIAADGIEAFYRGSLTPTLVTSLSRLGGMHSLADFADFASFYVDPIRTGYRGLDIIQIPPSGQGLTALLMLNILEGFDHREFDPAGADRFHLQIEASRLAYGIRDTYVADPAFADVPVETILSETFAEQLRDRISLERAMPPDVVLPNINQMDTVYLTVVDSTGNVCSLISSLFYAFGSGKVCPETGVAFQNRGAGFRVQLGHPNRRPPAKATTSHYHPSNGFAQRTTRTVVWRYGWSVPADWRGAYAAEYRRLSNERAGGPRCAPWFPYGWCF